MRGINKCPMWEIKNPTIQKAKLDFTSSEQGFVEVSQLVTDNVVLMNALELMEFEEDRVQLLICDHCGIVHCKSGDWISFRKSGNYILLIPAFEDMKDDEWNKTEYTPPRYFKKEGAPYFIVQTYEEFQREFSDFPATQNIKNLKMCEAMRLAQSRMPLRIFGQSPNLDVRQDKFKYVIASSEGEANEQLQRIEKILRDNYENNSAANIRLPLSEEEIIYLFIDVPEFSDWQALIRTGKDYHLLLDEEFVVEEDLTQ